jgi:drug/metabolite transporter (DMT)-like permease
MASHPDRPFIVYPILAAGLVCFSMSAVLVRAAADAPGLAIAVWRTAFAALMLAPVALARIGPEVRAFTRRDAGLIVAAGVLLGVHFITWIESLYHTSVASTSVLVTTSPIFLAVLGFVFLKERLAWPVVASIVLAVAGAVLIALGDATAGAGAAGPNPLLGNSLSLFAALLVSIYLLIGRVVRQKASWLAYVFPLYSVVALTTFAGALLMGTPLLGYAPGFYGLCALMALGPQIIGHGSFNYAVRYFPTAFLGLLSLVEPVGASLLAYLLFDEVPGPLTVAGIVVVLGAIAFSMRYRARRSAPPIPAVDGTAPAAGR